MILQIFIFQELVYYRCVDTVNQRLYLEQNFFNVLLEKMEKIDPPGYSFMPQIQKEVYKLNLQKWFFFDKIINIYQIFRYLVVFISKIHY